MLGARAQYMTITCKLIMRDYLFLPNSFFCMCYITNDTLKMYFWLLGVLPHTVTKRWLRSEKNWKYHVIECNNMYRSKCMGQKVWAKKKFYETGENRKWTIIHKGDNGVYFEVFHEHEKKRSIIHHNRLYPYTNVPAYELPQRSHWSHTRW